MNVQFYISTLDVAVELVSALRCPTAVQEEIAGILDRLLILDEVKLLTHELPI